MTKIMIKLTTAVALSAFAVAAFSDAAEDALVINEEINIVTRTAAPEHMADTGIDEIMSGWLFRSENTRDFERDDFENPAVSAVDEARDVWAVAEGTEGKACKDCHENAEKMAGVRTKMPKVAANGELWSLENFINDCRTERMGAEAWGWNDSNMVNMTALISYVSRGMPVDVAIDGAAAPYWEQGKEMYYTRTGQLELSCANCHEQNYGNMIRADHLSQGQINAFPAYRLKNAKLNSIHARFKGCVRDTRAETYKPGSEEFRALELYVASRGNGLSVEGPSVRN